MTGWLHRWLHPSTAKLLLYADNLLTEREAGRVKEHLGRCADCWAELKLMDETVQWLAGTLRPVDSGALAEIRARLVAELRKPTAMPTAGVCVRICLGPRSLPEMARRLHKRGGVAPAAQTITGPMLSAFLGRKSLPKAS